MTRLAIAAALALALAPAVLKYKYAPGSTCRYRLTEEFTSAFTPAGRTSPLSTKLHTTLTVTNRVVSYSKGQAVVDERRTDGVQKSETPTGTSESVVAPTFRRVTYGPTGKVVSVERRAAANGPVLPPDFLDGLAFPFPVTPVSAGATWSGVSTATGPAGKPISVRFTSKHLGNAAYAGHPCARIQTRFSSTFTGTFKGATKPMQGTVNGTITTYFATDIGQDAGTDANLSIKFSGGMAGPQPSEGVLAITDTSHADLVK